MSDQRGLTLLEVLIALALVGLVGVIAVLSLRLVSHAWERGEVALDTTERVRFVTDLMTRELRSALPYMVRLSEDEQAVAFSGGPTSVRFVTVTRGLAAAVPEGGLREVTYALGSGGLYRTEAPASDRHFFEPSRGVSVLLEPGLIELSLQYLHRPSGTWHDSWASTVISLKEAKDEETDPADFFPGAVVVNLALLTLDGTEERLPPVVISIPSRFPPEPKSKAKAGGAKPVGKGKAKGKGS